jgi:HSP20 family molecular chaperone IbpA
LAAQLRPPEPGARVGPAHLRVLPAREEEAKVTRSPYFNSPFLLGFDQLEQALERISKTAGDGYPPYNIEQLDDSRLRISLAVAGFSRDDLVITVENTQLTIRGRQGPDDDKRVFMHRGIAARQFQRSFVLADGIEVVGAELADGLLDIDLVRPPPASRQRVIEIKTGVGERRGGLRAVEGGAKAKAT